MTSLRKHAMRKLMEDVDGETKRLYIVAEKICRKEYERAFQYDLDLPIGHRQNRIYFSSSEERNKHLLDFISFWENLKEKYFEKCNDPLASAVAYFCDVHATGMWTLLEDEKTLSI